ncbi:MAG: SDR family NAD(P)-dependent oxidoreductase [Xanthomonadaceae bacterium]|nr:SDR family NAD(P)-dependent oxidoreductase [Xanthomonadaceae bacterium]
MKSSDVRAVVTGGASGLGLAAARRNVADGGRVTLLDLNNERGAAAAAELGEAARYLHLDVSDEAAAETALAQAREQMGGLNAAVCCAGILGAGRTLGREGPMPLERFATTVRVNLIGSFNIAKAAASLMQHNEPNADGERGAIVFTASIAAWEGQIGQAAYSASKGGVIGMVLPLAREFTRIGVRVMAIAPGVFHTPMVDGMPEAIYQSLCAQVPFPSRLGDPAEFADTVAYILRNGYLNGSAIRVDGAIRLQPK